VTAGDGATDGAVVVDLSPRVVAVHDVISATSTAAVACVHDHPRCGAQDREIISTTLPGHAEEALLGRASW